MSERRLGPWPQAEKREGGEFALGFFPFSSSPLFACVIWWKTCT